MQKQCTLRIVTYNIWNNDEGQDKRAEKILQELHAVNADIVGLQEVTSEFYEQVLKSDKTYPYSCFYTYSGENEGLAILSRRPIEGEVFLHTSEEHACSNALNIVVCGNQLKISITKLNCKPRCSFVSRDATL